MAQWDDQTETEIASHAGFKHGSIVTWAKDPANVYAVTQLFEIRTRVQGQDERPIYMATITLPDDSPMSADVSNLRAASPAETDRFYAAFWALNGEEA